jgi:hypothetical protein
MIDVFRDSGFPVEMRTQSGEMRVALKTAPAPAVRIAPWPSGGWAVSLQGHPTPVPRHRGRGAGQGCVLPTWIGQ